MDTLLLVLNLLACAVVCIAAMFFYLRHNAPECLRHHFNQVALILVSLGAFASGLDSLRGGALDWWRLVLHIGVAMFAAKAVAQALSGGREVLP